MSKDKSLDTDQPHPYYDEATASKESRIRDLFDSLERSGVVYTKDISEACKLPPQTRFQSEVLKAEEEAFDYEKFKAHVLSKEEELWNVFSAINQKGDHRLRPDELEVALKESGIHVTRSDIKALVELIDTAGKGYIDFENWRNFLLLLPHETTLTEIYRYYQTTTQINSDAEVVIPHTDEAARNAYKYLTAGAIAGCVSRTCTAPLDRLKVYLITHTTYQPTAAQQQTRSASTVLSALKTLYQNGGLRGFYVGNGLNVIKIIPESAIKFYVFETSKAVIAQMTGAQDKNSIPVHGRFIAGGLAGLCSQFCIYPLETLKTRIMSSQDGQKSNSKHIALKTIKEMYKTGGPRAFWPGLLMSLMGVFPYQALDMGIYETLKVSYLQSMDKASHMNNLPAGAEKPHPNVLVLWMCGMVSGSIGASSVYPLNMIRTRLQAQGTVAHPYVYTSAWDVAHKTYRADGIRGFYKGLGPTLFKVVPSISISYAVYEFSKRSLGIS
ncbi:hypothetical protein MFLAVUS_008101 [Mucor flavus]|uniref:EF-hand domain-containing protein n=1 Tax=Mucor flavus TaxID=439312 RepID=A0ABP9Z6B1_9FUNG